MFIATGQTLPRDVLGIAVGEDPNASTARLEAWTASDKIDPYFISEIVAELPASDIVFGTGLQSVKISARHDSFFSGTATAQAWASPLGLPSGGPVCDNGTTAAITQPAGNYTGNLTAQFLFGGYGSVSKQPVAAGIGVEFASTP